MNLPPLRAPFRRRQPSAPRRRRSPGSVLLRWLGGALAAVVLIVLALRWLPLPTTAFMLQSPVRPVHYDWVPAQRISRHLKRAVVASEDQKFFEHHGFDFEAIEKAAKHNRKSKRRRGASTISQQTAKNLFLWSGGGYFRKGLEVGFTVLIETLWSKNRILEVYLNVAEFGPGIYGVEAAARQVFGKSAAQLSAAEAARLVAVLPSPRRWSARNPGTYVRKRSAWILRQMGHAPTDQSNTPWPPPAPAPDADPEPDIEDDTGDDPADDTGNDPEKSTGPAPSPPSGGDNSSDNMSYPGQGVT
ncbi:MAG: monofunctional biosynthetic peptidoglycan transglycosylase [Sinimarinibacterium sp.]|jgi:monofunctional biosynthetic peptidoglycan transglycosylase